MNLHHIIGDNINPTSTQNSCTVSGDKFCICSFYLFYYLLILSTLFSFILTICLIFYFQEPQLQSHGHFQQPQLHLHGHFQQLLFQLDNECGVNREFRSDFMEEHCICIIISFGLYVMDVFESIILEF